MSGLCRGWGMLAVGLAAVRRGREGKQVLENWREAFPHTPGDCIQAQICPLTTEAREEDVLEHQLRHWASLSPTQFSAQTSSVSIDRKLDRHTIADAGETPTRRKERRTGISHGMQTL